jgi:hypothetical protein
VSRFTSAAAKKNDPHRPVGIHSFSGTPIGRLSVAMGSPACEWHHHRPCAVSVNGQPLLDATDASVMFKWRGNRPAVSNTKFKVLMRLKFQLIISPTGIQHIKGTCDLMICKFQHGFFIMKIFLSQRPF